MIPRFNKNDLRITAHYLGLLIMLFGAIMLAPLIVSMLYGEWDIACHYVLGIGISLTAGALLRLAKIEPQRMMARHAIAITGTVWIIGAIFAAIPLFLSGHYATFLDAVFEGVSGLTATGLTMIQDIDHVSMGDNMWRFTMQFVGGQGVIVVALSLGIFARTGTSLYSSEGRDEGVVPNVMNTARFIWKFAIAAVLIGTIVMSIILFLGGMDPARGFFHALWITIGAYDTGGFAAGSLSLISYHSWALELVAMLLMMFGSLNFALVAQVHKGNWREFVRDIEVRTLTVWTIAMVAVFVAALGAEGFLSDYASAARRGIFTIVSATTNTGFQILTTEQITMLLSSGAFFLVAVAMAVGGSSASTAGGIKALRVGLIFKGIGLQVRKMLQPRSAQITTTYNHIGKHTLAPELLSSAMIIAALYVISYVIGALAGIAYGYEALDATFESISAASNAGLSSGIVSTGMPVPLELLYILQMWLGRLEFITLLGLLATLVVSVLPRRKTSKQRIKLVDDDEGGSEQRTIPHKTTAEQSSNEDTNTKGRTRPLAATVCALLLSAVLVLSLACSPLSQAYAQGAHTSEAVHDMSSEQTGVESATSEVNSNEAPTSELAESEAPTSELAASEAPTSELAASEAPASELINDEVTISELAALPSALNDSTVVFSGEVVGEAMRAGNGHVWVTLSDGAHAMSVYLPEEMQEAITYTGHYEARGAHLRLEGQYHTNCAEHEGLNDVHVSTLVEVIDNGRPIVHIVDYAPLVVGLMLVVFAGLLSALYYYLRQRNR